MDRDERLGVVLNVVAIYVAVITARKAFSSTAPLAFWTTSVKDSIVRPVMFGILVLSIAVPGVDRCPEYWDAL